MLEGRVSFETIMITTLFQDDDSIPLNNFLKAYILPAVIIAFILIVIPLLSSDSIDWTILFFIIPGGCLLVYQAILWYNYSKSYLYKLDLDTGEAVLYLVDMKNNRTQLTIPLNDHFKMTLKEALLALNTSGISVLQMNFIKDGIKVHKQYPVGKWGTNEFKAVLRALKKREVKVESSIPIVLLRNEVDYYPVGK
jgi:hypothetical protein